MSIDKPEDTKNPKDQPASRRGNPLEGLTREDFRKLGLPMSDATSPQRVRDAHASKVETDGAKPEAATPPGERMSLSGPRTVAEEIAIIQHAFSPLAKNQTKGRTTAYERCLRSLLVELKWPGEERHIVQAMPHFQDMDSVVEFRGVLHHLGFESAVLKIAGTSLAARLPCLILTDLERPIIGLRVLPNKRLLIYDGSAGDLTEIDIPKGIVTVCLAQKSTKQNAAQRNRKISWFYEGLRNFNGNILFVVGLTFVANLLALATPIFTMNVYNRVIGSKSLDTLVYFVAAILGALLLETYLRSVRGRMIAYVGARFNTQLLIRGFERILNLPISMTESASVSQQIVRLRQFENVQSFFTGPLVSAGLDLPFTIVFILAISLIHPLLAAVPVVLALIFGLLGLISMPMTKRNVLVTGKSRHEHQNLLIETVNKRDSIRQLRAEDVWIKRWHDTGEEFSARRFHAQFFDTVMHTLAQSLVMVAGVATLWIGSLLVIERELSVGALIAVMMFVWRVLSPVQTAFLSLNRVGQFAETARQADLLMALPPERQFASTPTLRRKYSGRITFDNVSFRYGLTSDPVFRGLSVDIPAGQVIAVTGNTASGKGTFLKLIMGLYRPQSGAVYLDGLNLQQLDVDEVRTSIGYVAPKPDFFYGTIAQNIRLANPAASDRDVEEAMSSAGIWLPHPQLAEGIETRLTTERLTQLPNALKQCLSLARAYAKKGPIYLLDTPTALLNPFEQEALFDRIADERGQTTIVIATNDDALIRRCDRVLYLRNGVIAFDNTPAAFFKARAA